MNNNYHTQMDKPNMLNEIAANNHLMQNFSGTPINKNQQMQSQMQSQIPAQMQSQMPSQIPPQMQS